MKIKELRDKTSEELRQQLYIFKKELFGLKYQSKTGRLEKPGRIRNLKRDIARINTIVRERSAKEVTAATATKADAEHTEKESLKALNYNEKKSQ